MGPSGNPGTKPGTLLHLCSTEFPEDPLPGTEAVSPVTLRCAFCDKLNRVDLARAADRPACGECGKPMLLDRPVKVADEDFAQTVEGTDAPVLVDFYADWCGPCRMVAPFVDEIARANQGKLLVAKVDTDRAPNVSTRFGIRSIPTLIVFRDGKEVGRSVGFEPDRLKALIAEVAA
jgi:thioredoxin 2